MRVAGRLAADVSDMIGGRSSPEFPRTSSTGSATTISCTSSTRSRRPLNYRGFPKSICTSVNHVVCHGIPSERVLKNGDIVNIDVTVIKDGYHGDTSRMFFVGEPSIIAERLARVVLRRHVARHPRDPAGRAARRHRLCGAELRRGAALFRRARVLRPRHRPRCFTRIRRFCTTASRGTGVELVPGMTITVEPMVNAGKRDVKLLADGWTVVTKDHSLSAQWEHTVLDHGNRLRGTDARGHGSRGR